LHRCYQLPLAGFLAEALSVPHIIVHCDSRLFVNKFEMMGSLANNSSTTKNFFAVHQLSHRE